jgi:PBP1b-binding outer membrane lipoprotein LpoB
MRKYGILGAALCLAAGVAGCSGDDAAPVASTPPDTAVNFIATDEPGSWFKCIKTVGCVNAAVSHWPSSRSSGFFGL